MVQGKGVKSIVGYATTEKNMKYSGFQKKEPSAKESDMSYKHQVKSLNDKNYGAWGPIYKNRENFNQMHIC